jgi:hypothetical protein
LITRMIFGELYVPPCLTLKSFWREKCIYVFCIGLRANSDYFPTRNKHVLWWGSVTTYTLVHLFHQTLLDVWWFIEVMECSFSSKQSWNAAFLTVGNLYGASRNRTTHYFSCSMTLLQHQFP